MDLTTWLSIMVLLIGVIAIYLVYRAHMTKGSASIKVRVEEVEQQLDGKISQLKTLLQKLEGEVGLLEQKGKRNSELFSTVLHGFDFIVQGCKRALESHGSEELPRLDKTDVLLSNNDVKQAKPEDSLKA